MFFNKMKCFTLIGSILFILLATSDSRSQVENKHSYKNKLYSLLSEHGNVGFDESITEDVARHLYHKHLNSSRNGNNKRHTDSRRRHLENDELTVAEKQTLLDIHNNYRISLASGDGTVIDNTGSTYPQATNMNSLFWDEALAAVAEGYASTLASDCGSFSHNGNRHSEFYDYESIASFGAPSSIYLGENLGVTYTTGRNKLSRYTDRLQSMWDEDALWSYKTYASSSINGAGHFTQMAWADTRYIGCGIHTCVPSGSAVNYYYLVCNYWPGGNYVGQYPYESGTCVASNCDADRTNPCENGMCAGCMDPDFKVAGSTDNPSDCSNGFISVANGGVPTYEPTQSPQNAPTESPQPSPTESPVPPTPSPISPTASPVPPTPSPTNNPTNKPSDGPTPLPTPPTEHPTMVPTAHPNDVPNLSIRKESGSIWYYELWVDNVQAGDEVTEVDIRGYGSSTWIAGVIQWNDKWAFSSLGGLALPWDVRLVNNNGEDEIIVEDLIENVDAGSTFDVGTNFGVVLVADPTSSPTKEPSMAPTDATQSPTRGPIPSPTASPIDQPTETPTQKPTRDPTLNPVSIPTETPTTKPTRDPTLNPVSVPTDTPTAEPSSDPTLNPVSVPTKNPTPSPSPKPTTGVPTSSPVASSVDPILIKRNGIYNLYYFRLYADDVTPGVTITKMAVRDSGSPAMGFVEGAPKSWGPKPFEWANPAGREIVYPMDVRLTASDGSVLTGYAVVDSFDESTFNFGQNFAAPVTANHTSIQSSTMMISLIGVGIFICIIIVSFIGFKKYKEYKDDKKEGENNEDFATAIEVASPTFKGGVSKETDAMSPRERMNTITMPEHGIAIVTQKDDDDSSDDNDNDKNNENETVGDLIGELNKQVGQAQLEKEKNKSARPRVKSIHIEETMTYFGDNGENTNFDDNSKHGAIMASPIGTPIAVGTPITSVDIGAPLTPLMTTMKGYQTDELSLSNNPFGATFGTIATATTGGMNAIVEADDSSDE